MSYSFNQQHKQYQIQHQYGRQTPYSAYAQQSVQGVNMQHHQYPQEYVNQNQQQKQSELQQQYAMSNPHHLPTDMNETIIREWQKRLRGKLCPPHNQFLE